MELIKRYIYAVGKRLAKKQRSDIEKELQSSIYDNLEDTYGKKDDYTNEEVTEILKELGEPSSVAAGYQKNSGYLIGPELINTYLMIIKIVSGAVTLGLLVSFIIGLFRPELTIGTFVLEFLGLIPSILMGIITAIGFVTVIFYLIEKNIPGYKLNDFKDSIEFNPNDLPKVPIESERISIAESVFGIIFTIIGIVIFNVFASRIGVYYADAWGDNWHFVQIFSIDAVRTYLPFWNITWFFALIFQIFCLIQREWNIKIRIFDIFNSLLSIGVLIMMIKGPELVNIRLLMEKVGKEIASALNPMFSFFKYSLDTLFTIILIFTIIAVIVKIVKLFIRISEKPSRM